MRPAAAHLALFGVGCSVAEPPMGPLVIGPGGVGALDRALPLTIADVAPVFPGYEVIAAEELVEGRRFAKLAVRLDGEVLVELLPGPDGRTVALARTHHPLVSSPADEVVGATLADAPPGATAVCVPDTALGQPARACAQSADARFWRVYAAGEASAGPVSELSETPEGDLRLIEMRWLAAPMDQRR